MRRDPTGCRRTRVRAACAPPRSIARRALRADPTAAPTARCRTASTRQAVRRRSSEVRAAAHGGARGRACPVRHRVARPSRQVQPAHASCAGPPWSAGARLPVGRRCLGSRRQRLWDTRSVGPEFVLAYPAAERSPTPQAEGRDVRRPGGGRGPIWRSARPLGVATRTLPGKPARPAGRGPYRHAHTSSVARRSASTVGKRPMVVMGERPGEPSSRRYATPAVAVEGDGAADLRAPRAGLVAGGELRPGEAGALVGLRVG